MRITSVVLPGVIAATAATAGPALTAQQLDHLIGQKGASYVARQLSEQQFDLALRQADSGSAPWLRAIAALRAGTDGARSEGIDHALSDALQTNPATVLTLADAHSSLPRVDWLCRDRAIEPSPEAVKRFSERATRAVEAVSDPALRPLRDACLASLRRGG